MTISPMPLACPPRFGTPRNLDRPTLGPAVAQVAAWLGKPFMPWQTYVADVALEIDPATGRLAYDEFRITVPRQSGKTMWELAKATHRCSATGFFGPRQQVVYTAQTRKDARKKFEEDFAPDLEASRKFRGVVPHWGNGNEHIRFPNRSRFGIESTTEKAGHGGTLDEAYIDEAFAQVDGRLEQAFGPAMITRRNTQTGVVSTAGWLDASPYLWAKVDHGRQLIEAGEPARVAYFEWSAPEDADPYDRAVWRACMPALGFTIDEDAVAAELTRFESSPEGLNGFRRAYLNLWVPKAAPAYSVFPEWEARQAEPGQITGPPAIVVDVALDRSFTSIGVAGRRADGRVQVELPEYRPGVAWVVERCKEMNRTWHAPVVLAANGPAAALQRDLEDAGVPTEALPAGEVAQACAAMRDAVREGTVAHLGDPVLNAAAENARLRSGESSMFARKGNQDISPLYAVTLARWVASRQQFGGVISLAEV